MKALIVFCAIIASVAGVPRFHGSLYNASTLIVGERPVEQGEVPYQLSLQYNNMHKCGASIIEVQEIVLAVTAAHCTFASVPVDSFTLVAGDISLSDTTGIEQTRQVSKIVNHENFNYLTYENDIALLFIDEPFEFNDYVKPIPLPETGVRTTDELSVSGWGTLEYQGSRPDVMQVIEVPIVNDEDCQSAYAEFGDEIFDSFICAGLLGVGGKDACQGDSGGPARSIDGDYLAGIVSWGEDCADPRYPGIYTDTSYFIEWIHDQVAAHLQHAKK